MHQESRSQAFCKPCACQHAIGELGGRPALALAQGALSHTRIANPIERLASRILAKALAGWPDEVHFFEDALPGLNALPRWQAVSIADTCPPGTPAEGLAARFTDLVAGDTEPTSWDVDEPLWRQIPDKQMPVHIQDRGHLQPRTTSEARGSR